jgi:hypothetical protein
LNIGAGGLDVGAGGTDPVLPGAGG